MGLNPAGVPADKREVKGRPTEPAAGTRARKESALNIGSIDTSGLTSAYPSAAAARSANDTAQAKLDRDAEERSQLEYLQKKLGELKHALAVIQDTWQRSDQKLPAGPALALSRAVLSQQSDATVAMAGLTPFADVSAGTLSVNGSSVAFDPATDSLQDVIDRINSAGTGATASLDDTGLRLQITADDNASDLTLADGGSGLLAALGVSAGSRSPQAGGHTPGMSWGRADDVAEALADAMAVINDIFGGDAADGEPTSALTNTRKGLQKAIEGFWGAETTGLPGDLGFSRDFEAESGGVVSFTERTAKRLVDAIRHRPAAVETMLFGSASEGQDGLLGRLELQIGAAQKGLDTTMSIRGLKVDAYA